MPNRPSFFDLVRADIQAAVDNDPAARGPWAKVDVILTYAGFHAIFLHRVTHLLYRAGIPILPRVIAYLNRFLTGIEIHPAARIGAGFFIDHGMGVVIGETSIIGENCVLFHQVTLGGTGKQTGKRHPTLKNDVVVGAGAKILGNITLGNGVYVGANSVVLTDVPDQCTVVGIPGRIVRAGGQRVGSAHALDHIHLPDPVRDRFIELGERLDALQEEMDRLQRGRSAPIAHAVETSPHSPAIYGESVDAEAHLPAFEGTGDVKASTTHPGTREE